MKTNTTVSRFLAVLLALCLTVSSTAVTGLADGKSGKKSYREGLKHEQLQQWDLAAQEFAMAVAAEPNNHEYRLHYARALQNASIMFVKRGDDLAKQGDYASAYNAYRQALGYDQGNEMASLKMKSMLELQKDQALGLGQYKYNERTGNLQPISNDIQFKTPARNRDAAQDIIFKDIDFKDCVKNLSRSLGLNVLFDESVRVSSKISIELRDVTMAKAFDLIMLQNKMTFQQVDRKTIIVFADNAQTRLKFEQAAVKTFPIGNIKLTDARTVVNTLLPGRPVSQIEDQKMLIVKGTPSELQLVQDILDSVDKNISEVVIDVEIYEVSNDAKIQIGNQITTDKPREVIETRFDKDGKPVEVVTGRSATLADLGGIARGAFALAGTTFSPFAGTGGLIGLPPTSLSLLQSRGHSRLLNKIQIHALDGQSNNTKVGRSVPVSLGQNYGSGIIGNIGGINTGTGVVGGNQIGGINTGLGLGGLGLGGGGLFNSIQYKDVGLVIEAKPKITNEGYVELNMKIETSNVEAGADPLTPNFTQRSLSTTSRIQDGVTAIVASVMTDSKGDSRTTVPVLGMLPLIGRLFTTPNQESRQSDIVITVTPHIIRAAEITKDDNLARLAGALTGAGGQGSGMLPSIEEVLFRAQLEEEQERRLVAAQRGLPAEQNNAQAAAQTQAPLAVPGAVRNVSNTSGSLTGPPPPDTGLPVGPSGTSTQFQNRDNPNPNLSQARKSVVFQGDPNSNPNWNTAPASSNNLSADTTFTPPVEPNPVAVNPGLEAVPNTVNPNGPIPIEGLPNGVVVNGPNGPVSLAQPGVVQPAQPSPPTGSGDGPQLDANGIPITDVKPARVVPAIRPPHIEQAIQEMRLRELKERQAELNNAQKVTAQQNLAANPRATTKGAPADFSSEAPAPMRMNTPKAGAIELRLSPQTTRLQTGKPVLVNLLVDAQTMLSNATLSLRFDPAKLQVKSVRDGDMLGKQADLMHTLEGNSLIITANAAGGRALKASGRLLVIEFVALATGETTLSFNERETQIYLGGETLATLNVASVQLTINR